MNVNSNTPTDLLPPQLAVTNDKGEAVTVDFDREFSSVTNSDQTFNKDNDSIREQLDKYSISSNEQAADDEVPHFPIHVLKDMHASPTLASNEAHTYSPHDDMEDDFHTVNSADLDLEAVGKDSTSR